MKKKQIIYVSGSHYRKLKKFIKQMPGEFNKDTIHEIRVEYKKLRAFFRMLSEGTRIKRKIKPAEKLKKLYKLSGAFRDLQLQRIRILESLKEEIKKPLYYLNMLANEMEELKPGLIEIAKQKPVDESKKKTDASLPDKFQSAGFKFFIEKKWNTIGSIVKTSDFSDENIHTIRKNLKDLFYNVKSYMRKGQSVLPETIWKEKDENYFIDLLEDMGDFQDKCTAILLIKLHWLNRLEQDERHILENLKNIWIENKINLKQQIIQKLKPIMIDKGTGTETNFTSNHPILL